MSYSFKILWGKKGLPPFVRGDLTAVMAFALERFLPGNEGEELSKDNSKLLIVL